MTFAVYRAPMVGGVERALDCGVCGMSADDERSLRRVDRFEQVPDGSFVWTRTDDGEYFLGRLHGTLREDRTPDAIAAGLIFVRDCRWTADPVPEHEVPAATVQTFARGGRNFQQTHDPRVGTQSAAVWRSRGGDPA